MYRWILVPAMLVGFGCSESAPKETAQTPAAETGAAGDQAPTPAAEEQAATPAAQGDLLEVTMNRIDGTPESLEDYKGKVVMVVNVASKCGLTPQYDQLEAMYEKYKDQGFVVLGFPANDFNGQEPGTNEEIQTFCRSEYGVTFPMFEKITVVGADAHPLFRDLASASAEPSWNFTKYLIDRDGHLVERIDPKTTPEDPAVVEKVESLLEG
jgi:glutathione peroxidase